MFWNLKSLKYVRNKKFLSKIDIYKLKRMWKGPVIINFESQILALFDNLMLSLFTKFNVFLGVFWPKIYQILYPFLGSLITHITITFKQDIKQSDRHMISWGKWNTLLHFDYFIPSILINIFFFNLLTLLHFYLDFGFYSTI